MKDALSSPKRAADVHPFSPGSKTLEMPGDLWSADHKTTRPTGDIPCVPEVIGMSVSYGYHVWVEIVHPAGRERIILNIWINEHI